MRAITYRKYGFIVFKSHSGWIAYNTSKEFEKGHTHLCSKASAECAVKFCCEGIVPHRATVYYLMSLQRLTLNKDYYNRLQQRIDQINETKERKSSGKIE